MPAKLVRLSLRVDWGRCWGRSLACFLGGKGGGGGLRGGGFRDFESLLVGVSFFFGSADLGAMLIVVEEEPAVKSNRS